MVDSERDVQSPFPEAERRESPRISVGSNMCVLCRDDKDCLLCCMHDTSATGMKFSILNPDRKSEVHVGDFLSLKVYPETFKELVAGRCGIVAWRRHTYFGLKLS